MKWDSLCFVSMLVHITCQQYRHALYKFNIKKNIFKGYSKKNHELLVVYVYNYMFLYKVVSFFSFRYFVNKPARVLVTLKTRTNNYAVSYYVTNVTNVTIAYFTLIFEFVWIVHKCSTN